jgi:hypothetical protein
MPPHPLLRSNTSRHSDHTQWIFGVCFLVLVKALAVCASPVVLVVIVAYARPCGGTVWRLPSYIYSFSGLCCLVLRLSPAALLQSLLGAPSTAIVAAFHCSSTSSLHLGTTPILVSWCTILQGCRHSMLRSALVGYHCPCGSSCCLLTLVVNYLLQLVSSSSLVSSGSISSLPLSLWLCFVLALLRSKLLVVVELLFACASRIQCRVPLLLGLPRCFRRVTSFSHHSCN